MECLSHTYVLERRSYMSHCSIQERARMEGIPIKMRKKQSDSTTGTCEDTQTGRVPSPGDSSLSLTAVGPP